MKIMRDITTHEIIAYGTPPFDEEATAENYEIVDCNVRLLPEEPLKYIFHDTYFESVKERNNKDVHARFLLSQLANKTPEQIYAYMQSEIDTWAIPQNIKDKLREWLPLMAAILAAKVI